MRQYRGKDRKTGEWKYGWYRETPLKGTPLICEPDNVGFHIEVVPETVGQSTGLKDKNGKDLDWWQGDVFRIEGVLYQIVFEQGCYYFNGIKAPYKYTAASIANRPNGNVPSPIGSIHENPELLEAKDE